MGNKAFLRRGKETGE